MKRRTLVVTGGAALSSVMAGCTGGDGENGDADDEDDTDDDDTVGGDIDDTEPRENNSDETDIGDAGEDDGDDDEVSVPSESVPVTESLVGWYDAASLQNISKGEAVDVWPQRTDTGVPDATQSDGEFQPTYEDDEVEYPIVSFDESTLEVGTHEEINEIRDRGGFTLIWLGRMPSASTRTSYFSLIEDVGFLRSFFVDEDTMISIRGEELNRIRPYAYVNGEKGTTSQSNVIDGNYGVYAWRVERDFHRFEWLSEGKARSDEERLVVDISDIDGDLHFSMGAPNPEQNETRMIGNIGEVLVYNAVVSDSALSDIQEYLVQKWLPAEDTTSS